MAARLKSKSMNKRNWAPALAAALWVGLLAIAVLGIAGPATPASALDDIAIGGGATATASENGCPELTRIKYPWASCQPNAWGGVSLGSPGQPAPLECRLRLPNGRCAADPGACRRSSREATRATVAISLCARRGSNSSTVDKSR